MDKKFGKLIDVKKFKKGLLDVEKIKTLSAEYKQMAESFESEKNKIKNDKCPICSSKKFVQKQEIYGISYLACETCGLLFTETFPAKEVLDKYYSEDKKYSKMTYSDKESYMYRAEKVSGPKVDFIIDYVKSGSKRWLDVGSGIGDVVYNLNKRGFEAQGLELSKRSIEFSKEMFDVNLKKETIYEVLEEKGEGSFDIISYFGVLEHLTDPLQQVECALKLLTKNGLLVIEVPNAGSFSALTDMVFTDSVVRQMTPTLHLTLFCQRTLLFLAEQYGLKSEAIWFMGLDLYNLILHLTVSNKKFIGSDMFDVMLDLNNEIQSVFDSKEISDQMLFVARKG